MSRVEVTQPSAPLSDGMLQTVLPLSATSQFVKDNVGNFSALSLSTSLVGIGTTSPAGKLQVNNATNGALIARFKDSLAATTHIDVKTDSTLTDRMGLYWGSDYRFLSKQGASLFINCEYNAVFANGLQAVTTITPSEVQIGTITGARLGIKGSGTTSATNSLLVQNSAGTAALTIKDDGSATVGTTIIAPGGGQIGGNGGAALGWVYGGVAVANTSFYGFSSTSSIVGVLDLNLSRISAGVLGVGTGITSNSLGTIQAGKIGIGTSATSATATIQGTGTTSGANSLLVQNGAGLAALTVKDDRTITLGNTLTANYINMAFTAITNAEYIAIYGSNGFFGDGGLITGGSTIHVSARSQVDSTTKGFLPPRMTDAQARAIVTPANGLIVYNTTIDHLCCYQAGAWVKFNHSPM